MTSTNCTCLGCGWVHVAVSAAHAKRAVEEFNSWWETQPPEVQSYYQGPACIEQYAMCFLCGRSYKQFRDSVEGDCPEGCTLSPILHRDEEVE